MICRVLVGDLSGWMSGFGDYPTTTPLMGSMVSARFVGFVGFSKQERAPEKSWT
jgi:hypothetical protein